MDAASVKPDGKLPRSTALSRLEEENNDLLLQRDKLREELRKYRKDFIQAEERADKAEADVSHLKRALRRAEDENDVLKQTLKESEELPRQIAAKDMATAENQRSPSIEIIELPVITAKRPATQNSGVVAHRAPRRDRKPAKPVVSDKPLRSSTSRLIPYVSVPPRTYALKKGSANPDFDESSRALKRRRLDVSGAMPITLVPTSVVSESSTSTGRASASGIVDDVTAHPLKTPPGSPVIPVKLKRSPASPTVPIKLKSPPASPTVPTKTKQPSSPEEAKKTRITLKSPTMGIMLTGPRSPSSPQDKPAPTINASSSKSPPSGATQATDSSQSSVRPEVMEPLPSSTAPKMTNPPPPSVATNVNQSPPNTTPKVTKPPPFSVAPKAKVKSKREPTVFPSLQNAYLASTAPLSIEPPPSELSVPRAFLRLAYGGSDQQFLQYIPASASPSSTSIWTGPSSSYTKRKGASSTNATVTRQPQRRFVFPKMNLNPLMPSQPGEPGLLFASRHEVLEKPGWGVWCRDREAVWRYLGEYESTLVGKMTGEDFKSQSVAVKSQWGKLILGSKNLNVYVGMRARIALRLAGLIPTSDKQEAEDLEAKEIAAIKVKKGRVVTENNVVGALERGEERIDVLRMECVCYDHILAQDMEEKFKRYPQMVKEHKMRKELSSSSAGAKSAVKTGLDSSRRRKGKNRQLDGDEDEHGSGEYKPEQEGVSSRPTRMSRRIRSGVSIAEGDARDEAGGIVNNVVQEFVMADHCDMDIELDLTDYDYDEDSDTPFVS